MIVIRVELWSAVTGKITELARMHITNTGESGGPRRNYVGQTFIGRDAEALAQLRVQREGQVRDYPAERIHVWHLVTEMLANMGYLRKAIANQPVTLDRKD